MKKFILSFLFLSVYAAAAPNSTNNTDARKLGLRELGSRDAAEARYLNSRIAKLASLGINVGPLCIGLKAGCFTTNELGYEPGVILDLADGIASHALRVKSRPYNSSVEELRFESTTKYFAFAKIASENGISPQVLLYALDIKDRLEHEYLRAYRKLHPNQKPSGTGCSATYYSWMLTRDGDVREQGEIGDCGK